MPAQCVLIILTAIQSLQSAVPPRTRASAVQGVIVIQKTESGLVFLATQGSTSPQQVPMPAHCVLRILSAIRTMYMARHECLLMRVLHALQIHALLKALIISLSAIATVDTTKFNPIRGRTMRLVYCALQVSTTVVTTIQENTILGGPGNMNFLAPSALRGGTQLPWVRRGSKHVSYARQACGRWLEALPARSVL